MVKPNLWKAILLIALCVLLSACSGYRHYREAQVAEQVGDWDEAVLQYMELTQKEPANLKYRSALLRAKIQASHHHFEQAKKFREAGLLRQAMIELQKSVQLDPTNQYAAAELVKVRAELAAEDEGASAGTIEEMKGRTRGSTGQPPVLNPRSDEPIDLDFPEPVSVKKIYQALGKAFGINVLFDPKLRDQEISITLRQVTAQDALEILMRTAGHFYKVLDEQSIIVVADTPQNRRNYEDLIIQTFFLSNSEVKDVMAMLRSLVDARKVASNEKLNAIILRDTADKVKVAERIIEANDKAKAEVVVDVELLLLNTTALQQLGMSLSSYQIGLQIDTGGEDVPLRLSDLEFLTENDWTVTVPSFIFDFLKEATDAQVLAKPQLRITEGERARLQIGDRVPIPVTSFNTANTVGSNVVPITSFQYQDVGITIEVEPRVHHNNEISLKVGVEISNIAGNVDNQPIIGTRNIETTIRLQDGETNFLAGLIRTDETMSDQGVPGISDIPVIGRLFSSKQTQNQRTDIVMTMTPHIIRRADITEQDLTPIWVGTEQNITFRGGSPRVESDVEGPFDEEGVSPEDVQERMRRRLQQLPRGLRDADEMENGAGEEAPPSGVDLVPGLGRRSIFDDEAEPSETLDEEFEEVTEPDEPPLMSQGVGDDSTLALTSSAAPIGAEVGFLAGDGPTPVELRLVPGGLQVEPGDEFEMRLQVDARQPVSHFPLVLTFDPEKIEWLAAEAGAFLGGEGEVQVLAQLSEPGRLVVGVSRLGERPGIAGRGSVASLRFRALAPGESLVDFAQTKVLDAGLEPVAGVDARAARVVVGGPAGERPERPSESRRPPEEVEG